MEKVVKWSTLWVVDPLFAGSSPVLLPSLVLSLKKRAKSTWFQSSKEV